MTSHGEGLSVTSNVARDILQSAAVFKSLSVVIWEYVSNGLQYVTPGVAPSVVVRINATKKIATISDNGAGMDRAGLQNYFTMHGHNQDRLAGKAGRGMFGTGKSAAFGVADQLTVRTTRSGLRNTVRLARRNIEREAAKGNVTSVPLESIERDVPTSESNGTLITIEGIAAKCDLRAIINFLQRHFGKGYKDAVLVVNDHPIEYEEPSFSEERIFEPNPAMREKIGQVALLVKVSQSPLEDGRRGIDITSQGVLFETTLSSVEGKEMSQYLFGDLDVPGLANEGTGPNPAFNMTRDMQLNLENPLVQAVHAFVGEKLDEVRRELVERERLRKRGEDERRLQAQADSIAKLLNDDFVEYSDKISRVRAAVRGSTKDQSPSSDRDPGQENADLFLGGEVPAAITETVGDPGGPGTGRGSGGDGVRSHSPKVKEATDGEASGRKGGTAESKRPARGGFKVEYRSLGVDEYRAAYDRENRTISINLDFPQITAEARVDGIESDTFRRLSNEVAITEYAIAISRELVYSSQYSDPSDYIFEIRQTINRINRRASEKA